MTSDAAWPLVNGAVYLSTRLIDVSDSERLPEESNAIPVCPLSELAVGGAAAPFDVNTDWPMTSEAASPVVNGVLYLSTRLLKVSASHMLPEESYATTPVGTLSELAVGGLAALFDVNPDWPMTSDAA